MRDHAQHLRGDSNTLFSFSEIYHKGALPPAFDLTKLAKPVRSDAEAMNADIKADIESKNWCPLVDSNY